MLKDETTLAIFTWVGGISACVAIIVFLFNKIKKYVSSQKIIMIRDIIMMKDIILDNNSSRLVEELSNEGIINFFPYLETYTRYDDHGTPSKYMSTAKIELVYVGFWLINGVGLGNIPDTLKMLLNKGVKISMVVMNPFTVKIKEHCSKFFILDRDVEGEFTNIIKLLHSLYHSSNVSNDAKMRLHIKVHSEPINASVFLIDCNDENNGRILLDTKIHHNKDHSYGYGLEMKNNPKINKEAKSLYNRLKTSYLTFIENGRNTFIKTIDIDLSATKAEDIIEKVRLESDDNR